MDLTSSRMACIRCIAYELAYELGKGQFLPACTIRSTVNTGYNDFQIPLGPIVVRQLGIA